MASPLCPDPYKVLDVAEDANLAEIKRAHRKRVLECHPERVQDAALKASKQDEFRMVQQLMEKFVQTVQQQPKPLPLKRPHASLLKDLIDPLPSSPAPKRYRSESVNSFVAQWVESGSEIESYRERHCRSDTLLGRSDRDLIPRRLTKSASNMEFARDAGGFVVPPTPPLSLSFEDAVVDTQFDSQVDSQASLYAASIAPSDISGVYWFKSKEPC